MNFSFQLIQTPECSVCKALAMRDPTHERSIQTLKSLLAIEKSRYAMCVCYHRAVPRPWNPAYKARWVRYEKRLQRNREKKRE